MAYTRQYPLVITADQDGDTVYTGAQKIDQEFDALIEAINAGAGNGENGGGFVSSAGMRQAVLSAGQNWLLPNGLYVGIDADSAPVILTFANGFDPETGPLDILGSIINTIPNAWTLQPNETYYLYIDRNRDTGVLSFGYSLLKDLYLPELPLTSTLDQHIYDTNRAVMFRYNGSTYTAVLRIFVGVAVTTANSVTVTPYADKSQVPLIATEAKKLQANITINNIPFDGSESIYIIKVDTAGQADTALALAAPVTINGQVFDGTQNITILKVNGAVLADTATKLAVARTINGQAFDGSANITITNVANASLAAAATKLASARLINGTAFDGTANITITSVANATTANNVPTSDVGGNIWIAP